MKILFDTNAFSYLVQMPQFGIELTRLKELTKVNSLKVLGSITFFEEYTGFVQHDLESYHKMLSNYHELTAGKILYPWNYLMIMEIENRGPLSYEESLLDVKSAEEIFILLQNPKEAKSIFDEIYKKRKKYKIDMGETAQNILDDPLFINEHRKEIMRAYKTWFEHFDEIAQEWFELIFKPKEKILYKLLPYVRSFMNYLLTRVYERLSLCIPDRASDYGDRAYFTEAAAVDLLVTNDNAFARICSRVPFKSFQVFKVDKLKEIGVFGTSPNQA